MLRCYVDVYAMIAQQIRYTSVGLSGQGTQGVCVCVCLSVHSSIHPAIVLYLCLKISHTTYLYIQSVILLKSVCLSIYLYKYLFIYPMMQQTNKQTNKQASQPANQPMYTFYVCFYVPMYLSIYLSS